MLKYIKARDLMFEYQFLESDTGKKSAKVWNNNTMRWHIVDINSAKSVIAKGLGVIVDECVCNHCAETELYSRTRCQDCYDEGCGK